MLPRTLTSADATLCTASVSHTHALGPPQGPTYLPLGRTLSILVSTNNVADAHKEGFILPYTLHSHLPISGLAKVFGHGIFSTIPH